jgi:hypothetical protein
VTLPRVALPTLAALLLSAVAFVGPALRDVHDPDVWWHLRAGDDILSGRPGAFTEAWSFTAAGNTWINHEWLAEWRLALVRKSGGDQGVVVLAGLLVFVASCLLFRAARLEGLSPAVIALGLTFAALVAGTRFVPRPQVFSYALLALWLERLATARRRHRELADPAAPPGSGGRGRQKPPGLLFLSVFPLTLAIWTNLHGPVLGLGIGSVLILLGALPFLTFRRRAMLVAALLAAAFIHPQGYRALFDYIPHLIGGGLYNETIREWLPLYHPEQAAMSERAATWIAVLAGAVFGGIGLIRGGPDRRAYAAVLLILALAPVLSVRHRDLLAVFLVPATAVILRGVAIVERPGRLFQAGAALGALFLALVPGLGLFGYDRAWPPRPGLSEAEFPKAAVEFLAPWKLGSRVFNAYDYGGYLVDRLPRDSKVFIDGRYFVYGEGLYRDYLEIRDGGPSARALLDRYGADLLLVRYPQPDGYQGLARLARDWTDWSLVFWDDNRLVYVREAAAPPEFLRQMAYEVIDPTLPPRMEAVEYWRENLPGILLETRRAALQNPRAVRPLLVRALAYEYNGRDGDAMFVYRLILESHPANRPARDGVARIEARHPAGVPETPRDELTPGR